MVQSHSRRRSGGHPPKARQDVSVKPVFTPHIQRMTDRIDVLYNGSCPVCSREIALYQRHAAEAEAPVDWTDITSDALPEGLDTEAAAQRLHVVAGGQLIAGVPAFIVMWSTIPRWRWLARVVALPGVRQIATLIYDRILAPALYARHRRRNRLLS